MHHSSPDNRSIGTRNITAPSSEHLTIRITIRITVCRIILTVPHPGQKAGAGGKAETAVGSGPGAGQYLPSAPVLTSVSLLPQPGRSSVWQGLRFSDENQTTKFRKLMGMKEESGAAGAGDGLQQRQEQLFRDLDKQYSAARSVTHTQRGTGLGFGS